MKKSFYLGGVDVVMSSRFIGTVSNAWKGDKHQHNKFTVYVSTPDGRTSFTYYGSAYDCARGVRDLDEAELKNALECFLSDASAYDCARDVNDFCREFGYSYDEPEELADAQKVYKACERASIAARRVFGSSSSLVWDALTEC